ncbi:MAG: D-sedoheptulose-7-phosphate isomerase, partial [Nanopusillaceae archaeon]
MVTEIKTLIKDSISVKQDMLNDILLLAKMEYIVDEIVLALTNDHKILLCGNGGSAADAQHIAAEFTGRFKLDRKPYRAEALHVNTSYLTAVANDYSFEDVYSRLVEAYGEEGDILIAISTSGNSPNVVKAVEVANKLGMVTVGLTGDSGGKLLSICKYLINVPS